MDSIRGLLIQSLVFVWFAVPAVIASPKATQTCMDIKVRYDDTTDSVRVFWYPESTADVAGYVVTAYEQDGSVCLQKSVGGAELETTIPSFTALGGVEMDVFSHDASGLPIESSPREELITHGARVTVRSTQGSLGAGVASRGVFSAGTAPPSGPRSCVDVTMTSFDAGAFPMLYATVQVSQNGTPVGDYTQSEFQAFENGVLQLDLFHVTPPGSGGGVRLADIVFLIDTSGSMSSEIDQVQDNCEAFADALAASGIDYRLGLVQFGNSSGANPRIVGGGLTDDVSAFKSWVNGLSSSGSYEPGYEAIRLALQDYAFRPGTQKVFILITDEDSDGSLAGTIDMVLANHVTVHVAVDCSNGSSQAHYCGPGSVSDVSGGLVFDVLDDYTSVLDTITNEIGNTYIVRYKSSTPFCDGVTRLVDIVVTDPTDPQCTGNATASYTSCGAPNIVRTPETVALGEMTHLSGEVMTIAAEVTDFVEPYVQGVTLHVRTTGTASWTVVPMPVLAGDVYAAQIPVGLVDTPGVDYYLRATDGEVTSSDPSDEPSLQPYQIAVLPNEAPVLMHVPPAKASLYADCGLLIGATDFTFGVTEIVLYHRVTGELLWNEVGMTYSPPLSTPSDTFVIPMANIAMPSVEYYIRARDDFDVSSTWRTADDPYVLPVGCACNACDPVVIDTEVCFSELDGGAFDQDGTADGVLVIDGLIIEGWGKVLVDVPSAEFLVNGDVVLSGEGKIDNYSWFLPEYGPAITVVTCGSIYLRDRSRIRSHGDVSGGSIRLCAEEDIAMEFLAGIECNGFDLPEGEQGGFVDICAGGRFDMSSELAYVTVESVEAGQISIAACGEDDCAVSLRGRLLADGSGPGGTGGDITVDARNGGLWLPGADHCLATGEAGDGTITLCYRTVLGPEDGPIVSPAPTIVFDGPDHGPCDCAGATGVK